ncbi:hypothetical protein MSAN_02387100 [Mycena sanguinolenta]|uniref:F-box domain-containing protein n=1 Tax=Mycena sanguinolenta TaxID=230812 RepID=A0A8H7CFQ1_9AGAR|nr:hypothetical protein MSAN_02387100 [Mycena sanguinolenta]
MTGKFSLENLPEDLLLRMGLGLADIYTVLTISQVNTFFYKLASTKQLWLLLTKDLFSRGLIDIPSDEANLDLSCAELIAQVKRAVRGPQTWSPDSPTAPTLIQQFTIQLEHPASFSSLLPGGRYIVFRNQKVAALEFYSVSTGRLVWSWARPGLKLLETDFSVCRGSRVTASLIIFEQASMDMLVVIVDVDLESGHSREMQFPSVRLGGLHLRLKNLQSAEGYLGCIMTDNDSSNKKWMPFLINLRTEQYVILDCDMTSMAKLHIIPGYILLLSPHSEPLSVHFYSISSLKQLWRPLSTFNRPNRCQMLRFLSLSTASLAQK